MILMRRWEFSLPAHSFSAGATRRTRSGARSVLAESVHRLKDTIGRYLSYCTLVYVLGKRPKITFILLMFPIALILIFY